MKPVRLPLAWILPAILLAGCTSAGSGGPGESDPSELQLDIAASRTSGVAPLAVFFDATGTPALADGAGTSAPAGSSRRTSSTHRAPTTCRSAPPTPAAGWASPT
jgi:hypothetical protein